MEKELKRARLLVNKIVKKFNRNDLDWTVQISINSTRPNRVNYAAQIEAPANGLQPITWIKDNFEDLEKSLKLAEKGLNQTEIDIAWHNAEIERAKALIQYHEEAIGDLKKES